ncbi:MAG: NosD domain-containing protein [Candidatus Bathyarchaeia archaeon]
MKKGILILLIGLLLLLTFSFVRFRVYVYASPGVIYVPANGTIQATINNASSGDTIIVPSGTYRESLSINKSLSIVGENRTTTIIDGDGADNVISISSDNVTIESLTITKTTSGLSGGGILVSRSTGVVINDTQITNTSTGLTLDLTTNCAFSDDVIANNTNAVLIYGSSSNVFSSNAVLDNSLGVVFSGYLNNNLFSGNTFSDNIVDVFLSSDSNGNVFYHNNFLDENPIQVNAPSTNVWSREGEGNYWANYNFSGPSTGGIGDEPYYIDKNNQDNYPLMGVFSSYDITYNNEEFQVTIISNSTVTDFTFEVSRETGYNIVSFSALGEDDTFGFCRMTIPKSLMYYPLIIVDSEGEVATSLLSASDNATTYLYFTYPHGDQSITVISSEALQLQSELNDEYAELQADFDSLNATYQAEIANVNSTYEALLNSFGLLLQNFSQLQSNYLALNSSLQNNLANQSQSMQNIHNLTYIFAATTAAFLITTVYLSTRANGNRKPKARAFEEEGQARRAAFVEEH